jgi:hypothetical protein
VFTSPLYRNGSSSIVDCVFVSVQSRRNDISNQSDIDSNVTRKLKKKRVWGESASAFPIVIGDYYLDCILNGTPSIYTYTTRICVEVCTLYKFKDISTL